MKQTKLTITPEVARTWLQMSKGNRPLNPRHIEDLKREIHTNWKPDVPDPIGFDEDGVLINGHHRLTACVETGIAIECWVARDMPRETVTVLDGGLRRSLRDRFFAYSDDRTVKKLVNEQAGRAARLAGAVSLLYVMFTGSSRPSVEEATRIVRRFADSFAIVLDLCVSDRMTHRAHTLAAFVLGLEYAERQSERAVGRMKTFIEQTKTGELLEVGDPAHTLRKYLITLSHPVRRGQADGRHSRDSQWIVFCKVLRACQAAVDGEKMRNLPRPPDTRGLIDEMLGAPTNEVTRKLRLWKTEEPDAPPAAAAE